MPTPTKPINLSAKSSTLGASHYITFKNLTQGGKLRVKCNSNGEAVTKNTSWSEGDVISVEVQGKYNKGTTATVTKGGITANLGTLSEDTSTADVSL